MRKPDFHPTEEQLTKFEEIERILDVTYGPRILHPGWDPVAGLVGTILSQNTSDANSSRTEAALREQFPTWEEVIDADVDDIAEAIKLGGLSKIKAPRIQNALKAIQERCGELDLFFLKDMSVDDAMDWLMALKGVGPKTAACVLLFNLGMGAMPVDTHVGRVMSRLGVMPLRLNQLNQQRYLETLIGEDADRVYAVHVETISHGREICKAQRPLCEICPLAPHCTYYKEHYS